MKIGIGVSLNAVVNKKANDDYWFVYTKVAA